MSWRNVFMVAGVAAAVASTPAAAQSKLSLEGRNVNIVIGFGPGGGYDTWGRTLARHMGRHLPGNPTMVPQNMPGAGSFLAANHIYSVAPKDGTVLGTIARDAPLGPLSGATGAKFDPVKFTWLGTPTIETNVCIVHKRHAVRTFADAQKTEVIMGSTGPGTGTHTYPLVLNGMMGTKFKLVGGFPASSNATLAIERGEIDGICESYDSIKSRKGEDLKNGTLVILFQAGAEPNPELKGIPELFEFAKTEEQRVALTYVYAGQGLGRPFIAPPDLPADVARMLQTAFMATMRDPEFIADAARSRFDVDPRDGPYLEALIKKLYATPKPIVDKIAAMIK